MDVLGPAAGAAAVELADDVVKYVVKYEAGLPPFVKALIAAGIVALGTNLHLIGGAGPYAALGNAFIAYILSQVAHKV